MLVGDGAHGFQFHDQFSLNKKVREVVAQREPVFIEDLEWKLLVDLQSLLSQPMRKRIFVNLFEMAVPVVFVNGKTGLSHDIAQVVYLI